MGMGPYGGIRAAQLARPFLSELGMVPLPSTLLIPTVQNANIAESGEEVDNERVTKNTEKICKELAWYVAALGKHAAEQGPCPVLPGWQCVLSIPLPQIPFHLKRISEKLLRNGMCKKQLIKETLFFLPMLSLFSCSLTNCTVLLIRTGRGFRGSFITQGTLQLLGTIILGTR